MIPDSHALSISPPFPGGTPPLSAPNPPGDLSVTTEITDSVAPPRQEIVRQLSPNAKTVIKPEMKEPTHKIIGDIHTIQEKGSGSIPLDKVIETFGVKLTPEQEQVLTKRGDIQFVRTGAQGGTFVNKGDAVKFSAGGLDIRIPREVSGNYDSTTQEMAFHFADGKRISAGKLFFSFELEDLSADQQKIAVDMEGDSYDQYILFDPQH